ncbi:MAG: hypothetical protein AAFY08_04510 [Planctomycetota bacterium]
MEPVTESSASRQPVVPAKKMVGWGFGLWILSLLSGALAAAVLVDPDSFDNPVVKAVAGYGLYSVPTLLALGGTYFLLTASIRTAIEASSGGGDMSRVIDALERINKRLLLSDTAKRIAYRQEDLDVLRKTIVDDIAKHRFDAALALIAELSQTYGFIEEAESFRDQIAGARAAEQEAKVSQAIARLEDILARHDFERASAEVAKLRRLYPDSERVLQQERRVQQAREQYKHDIERQFLEAKDRGDTEKAMELMKLLDKYLTPQEAEPFREIARDVIGKQRENLGMQFKFAVQDKEWLRSVRIGEQIIREFPNTRMAQEVRERLDKLREMASQQQAASGGATV